MITQHLIDAQVLLCDVINYFESMSIDGTKNSLDIADSVLAAEMAVLVKDMYEEVIKDHLCYILGSVKIWSIVENKKLVIDRWIEPKNYSYLFENITN
jgi:hypothetical protein